MAAIAPRAGSHPVKHARRKDTFDSIDRSMLMEMLRERIADESLMRLVGKCLHVGILDGDEYSEPDDGTTQGSVLSPLLGNIYLHHVLDMWFEREVKPRMKGGARLIRYCDGMPEEALDVRVKVPPPQLPVQGSSSGAACAGDRSGQVPRHRPRKVAAEQQAVTKVNPPCSLVILRSGGRPSRRKGKAVRSREAMGTCTAMAPSGRQGRHVAKVQWLESGRSGRTIEEVAPIAGVYKADRRNDVGVRPEVGGAGSTRAGEDNITAPMVKLVGGWQTMMRREDFARGRGPAFINALEAASEL